MTESPRDTSAEFEKAVWDAFVKPLTQWKDFLDAVGNFAKELEDSAKEPQGPPIQNKEF